MDFHFKDLKSILSSSGLSSNEIDDFEINLNSLRASSMSEMWNKVIDTVLSPSHPFDVHRYLFETIFEAWDEEKDGPIPVWSSSRVDIKETNIGKILHKMKFKDFSELYRWSVEKREEFWEESIKTLNLKFRKKYQSILNLDSGVEDPNWLSEAKLNIAESCFLASSKSVAVIFQREAGSLEKVTYGELDRLSNRVANGLIAQGFSQGDAIAIDMVMTLESVAIYLGIVKAGCVVVSIADSFAPEEIKTRLRISRACGIFTQDFIFRGDKKIPLYSKVVDADAPKAIVLPGQKEVQAQLREGDLTWKEFLSEVETFELVVCSPDETTNILFSSGTTGDPKAIPWTHLTPLKSAVDGHFHQDIRPGEVVAWPTNLGWMMGPWLIYASLMNRGTMALFYGAPTTREFCEFVEKAKVNMLGLVPSIVKAWRQSGCTKNLDWNSIKLFSSTGECSNAEDYFFLMSLASYRPVIEYCGGTEIGGGYISGTVVQDASPGTLTTPCLGLDLCLLDEEGRETSQGEVFLIPPSIGLSQKLLNRDHHEVYFQGAPKGPSGEVLRRHGDQIQKLLGGFYQAQGRADDTMNLGGIKVSSAEIERLLNLAEGVIETAAIAVSPKGGGPSLLVIYAVVEPSSAQDKDLLKNAMQKKLREELNPLFKVSDIVLIDALPRTASNKVMRRVLRANYHKV